jgi:LysR family glycine cleavage system transcriptional activator
MLPSLNALRVFEVVARHRNFTRAAAELSISQSAVSHQIRNLERSLDVVLLTRHAHEASLTSDGDILFRNLSDAFAMMTRSVADVRASAASASIGVSLRSQFAARWLAPRMAALWNRHPGLNIRFLHSNKPADFSDPHTHVSIEWRHESDVPADGTLIKPVNLTPACSPHLITETTPLRVPSDLARHTLVHEADEASWREWLLLAGTPELSTARMVYYEDSNVRHIATVEGEGFSLVCPSLVRDDLDAGRLVCPFDIHLKTYAYYLVIPAARRENPTVRRFASWLLAAAAADT